MNKKEFIQNAIKNNYTGDGCKGWDWIRNNLDELNYIFNTKEYKECDGMKYECMLLLIETDILTNIENEVLETAWYINNDRIHKQKEKEKIKKFNDDGFYIIKSNKELHGKKIEFIVDNSDEMFGGINKLIGKLFWSEADKRLMAMKLRSKRRGCWVDNCNNNIYIKII